MKTLATAAAICGLLLSHSRGNELPAVQNLASQTASTFLNHADDAASLHKSAKDPQEAAISEHLKDAAAISANLAVSAVTAIHLYTQVDAAYKGSALEELKRYLAFVSSVLDAQINGCTWVASNSKRAGVTSEAEHLRKDLRTFQTYLTAFKKVRAADILPEAPEGLQKPIF